MSLCLVTQNEMLPELAWLRETLWCPSSTLSVGVAAVLPAEFRIVDSYALFPNGRRPRQLVPLGSRPAAASSLRRCHAGMGRVDRLQRRVMALGLQAGVVQPLLRQRLRVAVPIAARERQPAAFLKHHMEDVLGETEVELSVIFGPMRANRKPVLQLLSKSGETICYVKVGWNALTNRLITSETTTLDWLAERPLREVAVAQVLHRGEWRGRQLGMLSPLRHEVGVRGGGRVSPVAAMGEIAGVAGLRTRLLRGSSWWRETQERIRQRHVASHSTAMALVARRLEENHGDCQLTFGLWHGDLTPWNMGWADGRWQVWDWERSHPDVPVGFDALHWSFQQAFQGRRRDVQAGIAGARSMFPLLPAMGALDGSQPVLLRLYLVELYLRYAEDSRTTDDAALESVCHALVRAMATEMETNSPCRRG